MRILSIDTTIHGRVLVEDAADVTSSDRPETGPRRLIVAFHGYGQGAEDALAGVRRIPGADRWRIVAVQALHRFYTRDEQRVIASWMTRQDREEAIADNVAYVNRVVDEVGGGGHLPHAIVYVGFSQGAPMAYRAAVLGRHGASGVIAIGGDIPPELKADSVRWPAVPVLIGAGDRDQWFTAGKVDADVAFLKARGIPHEVTRFPGGHEWTDEFRHAAGAWLPK